MKPLAQLFPGSGYLIQESEYDTTNLVCRYGHIYQDGDSLCASLDGGTPDQVRKLKALGEVIMDGDFGELTVRFPLSRLREAARVLKPRQAPRN